jgi:hypothetical protein
VEKVNDFGHRLMETILAEDAAHTDDLPGR